MKFLETEVVVQQKNQSLPMQTNYNVIGALSSMMKPTSELLQKDGPKQSSTLRM